MKISDIVATQRRRMGLKQYQLAEITGIAPSQISIFERGSSGMVTTNLEKVLEALGLQIVCDKLAVQRSKARDCAHLLVARGMHDLRAVSREELATLIDDEELLLLPVVSDELYRKYCRSGMIDETNTWNHFVKLVHDYMLEELDHVYDPERVIPAVAH